MKQEQNAVVITAAGGPEVLQLRRVAVPEPRDDEVLIAVRAAGVNRHDCNQRRRGPTPVHSDVPGLEVAGEVAAVGRSVRAQKVGDPVCALVDGGGYGEYAIAKSTLTLPVPAGLDLHQAAALPEAAFTVWHNFFGLAALGPGESVLIHGGTSGVGTFGIQLLTALGHPVYATCGSADKIATAKQLGARDAYSYRDPALAETVRQATGGRGVDVVLDMAGAQHALANVEMLARNGRLLHLSPGDGASFSAPLRTIMAKSLRITGSLLRPLPEGEKAMVAAALQRVVWPLIAAGVVRPIIHHSLAMAEAAEAHRLMESGALVGKVMLVNG